VDPYEIATVVWINKYANDFDMVGSYFGVGEQIYDAVNRELPGNKFTVAYDWLIGTDSKTITKFVPVSRECSYTSFNSVYEDFKNLLQTLDKNNPRVPISKSGTIYSLLDMTTIVVDSLPWKNCEQEALGKLTTSVTEGQVTGPYCYQKINTPEWKNDGCCNPNDAMCCLPRNATISHTLYSISDTIDTSTCKYPGCIKASLESLATVSGTDNGKACDDVINSKLRDPRFLNDFWARCTALTAFKPYCLIDGMCFGAGINAKCDAWQDTHKISWATCSVPCDPSILSIMHYLYSRWHCLLFWKLYVHRRLLWFCLYKQHENTRSSCRMGRLHEVPFRSN